MDIQGVKVLLGMHKVTITPPAISENRGVAFAIGSYFQYI